MHRQTPPPPPKVRLRRASASIPRITARGQHVAPHEDFYHQVLTMPWWQFFVFVSLGFIGLNLVFATLYAMAPGSVTNVENGSFEELFYFSVQTMATIGYGVMSPANRFGHVLVVFEAIVSLVTTALLTGMTFAKFARPTARVLFAEKLVVSNRDGVPHLMVRMANWRRNQVTEATLRMMLLRTHRTREGDVLRVPVELTLVRDRTALFMLTWTAMHRIDATSPFYGPDAMDILRGERGEIFVSLNGLDSTMGQTIYAGTRYSLDDIVWNARYHDVLSDGPGGERIIDYTHFHEVVPEPPADA